MAKMYSKPIPMVKVVKLEQNKFGLDTKCTSDVRRLL